ncbi:MAG TPA: hypothetical protein VNV87_11235 [Acidimicrobiales bacterium]|nr:hypothetical protein [Acidimicrobiales bacterium]
MPDLVRCAEGGESPVAYLVEGEKDVDRLVAEGLCATTVFGGTGGTLPADFVECFRGFSQVIVLADNDAPGKKAARYRAELVAEVVGDVRLVEELPGVGHKGDASDFLDGGRTVEELCRVGDAGEQIRPASKMTENRSDVFLSATQAERLADFANERYRLGSDTKGEPFAIRRNGPNLALRMRGSGGFRQSLATQWRADTGKVLNQTALGDALAALEGEATNNDREEVFLRIARRPEGSGALLDLGTADGATVEIGPGGWSVLAASPVPFRRTALTGALPVPVRGGSLQDLRKVVNVEDEDWPLALAWLVSAFWPNVSHPVLLLSGEQGSAKSTSLRYLAGVLDASPAPLRPPSKDVESWVGMASGSLVVAIDNVSRIPGWFSDALCRAVTGEALVRRKLYTDDDHSIVTLRCLVGITAIDLGPIQGDLADRVVRIECPLIADESRWSDEDVNRHMEERGATIFGAFLDLASDVFEAHARVSLPGTPRMSDFARVLAAVDLVLGSAGYARYIEQRQALAASIIDGDPVARSLAAFIDGEGEWEGTTGNLLGSLTPPDPRPRTWPANPAALGQRLAKIAPGMRAAGYIIDHLDKADRRGNRGWHLAVRTEKPPEMAPVPPAREESVRTGHGPNRETSGNTARTARTARDAS